MSSVFKFTEEPAEGGSGNLILKICSIFIVWGIGLAFILMPYFVQRCRGNATFLGLANAFSGGIFLGIGLFHLLPESAEIIGEHGGAFLQKIPFSYFLAFCSYCLILFVEKIAFDSHSLISHDDGHGHGHSHGHGHGHEHKGNDGCAHDHKEEIKVPLMPNELSKDNESEEIVKNVILTKGHFSSFLFLSNSMINNSEYDPTNVHNKSLDLMANINAPEGHDHGHGHQHGLKQTTWMTPYILLIAIGLHGFFEGVALGIQRTIQGSTFLLIAILAHKWAESLTLGISFVKADTPRRNFIGMGILFSLIGPIGIILGLILSEETNELVEGIFLGISTGTFLYVACSEVVVEEFSLGKYYGWKFVLFVLAGLFTFGLALLELVQGEEEEKLGLKM